MVKKKKGYVTQLRVWLFGGMPLRTCTIRYAAPGCVSVAFAGNLPNGVRRGAFSGLTIIPCSVCLSLTWPVH